jgi:hypothetical protein
MMTDTNDGVDMMDEMMGAPAYCSSDELMSSTAVVSVPQSSTAAPELTRNGNQSLNTNPDEPLVPPEVGLTSNARSSNERLDLKDAPNIGPTQRPGTYTARGRACGSRTDIYYDLPWLHK